MNTVFSVSAIGVIRVSEGKTILELDKKYIEGIKGLQGFSHVNVLWWFNQLDEPMYRNILAVDKPYMLAPEKLGIFATRAPVRPNLIALTNTAVRNIDVEGGIIEVDYLDAEDGSPILDIKPYYPCEDRVKNVSAPDWCAHWPSWKEDSAAFAWDKEFLYPGSQKE